MAFVGSITQYQEVVIATLKAENAALKEALEFYADEVYYRRHGKDVGCSFLQCIIHDRGTKARAALNRMSDSMSTTPETPE